MVTDENPAEWHTDEYIKAWYLERFKAMPIVRVELLSMRGDVTVTAEIDFTKAGWPVRRLNEKTAANP